MTPSGEFSRRNFLTTVAATAAATLLPKALMANLPQDPVVNAAQ
jgi:TAT (twin-arginine translocation) pathway signal sequence